ncbi:hypothetical protein GF327_03170 [Candidatus Woesearchaeota archaeon]|nr:hypothetical protein [Candidatus Woesearchaeota archaeon]
MENRDIDYDIPPDLKEVVQRIAQDAEDMELRLSEFKFVHSMRMFGVAVGGAIFILGLLFILVSVFVFGNLFGLELTKKIRIVISATSGIIGIVQIIAGVLLIGK